MGNGIYKYRFDGNQNSGDFVVNLQITKDDKSFDVLDTTLVLGFERVLDDIEIPIFESDYF